MDGSPVVLAQHGKQLHRQHDRRRQWAGLLCERQRGLAQARRVECSAQRLGLWRCVHQQRLERQLDLAGFSDTINGLWGDGLITNSTASASTLTVGANNVSSTFAGMIQTSSGSIALTKTGSGTLTLSGLGSTYAGGTDR